MTSFVCINCGYRFDSDKKKECPYCGKRNVEKKKSADELVNNVRVSGDRN